MMNVVEKVVAVPEIGREEEEEEEEETEEEEEEEEEEEKEEERCSGGKEAFGRHGDLPRLPLSLRNVTRWAWRASVAVER